MNVEFLIAIILLDIILVLLNRKKSSSQLYLLALTMILTAVGQRGIVIGTLYVTPSVAILLFLTSSLLVRKRHERNSSSEPVPVLLVLFLGTLSIYVVVTTIVLGAEAGIGWLFSYVLGICAFVVIKNLIHNEEQLAMVVRSTLIAGAAVSTLGSFEYFFPELASEILPGFINGEAYIDSGFLRAPFSYFGGSHAVIFVVWSTTIALCNLALGSSRRDSRLSIFALVTGMLSIYISGARSSWLAIVLIIAAVALKSRRRAVLVVATSVTVVVLGQYIRQPVLLRIFDGAASYSYETSDLVSVLESSRLDLWERAVENANGGLGNARYDQYSAHNIFIEVFVKTGALPAIMLMAFYLQLLWRIVRLSFRGSSLSTRDWGFLFLMLAVAWTMHSLSLPILEKTFYSVPHWLMFAVAWYLPSILEVSQEADTERRHVVISLDASTRGT